jgi:thiamine biosynthesis lipoprotein
LSLESTARYIGRRFFLYNTICEVILHSREDDAVQILDACEDEANRIQAMLNLYDPFSELSRLNKGYCPGEPYRLSESLYAFQENIHNLTEITGGAFDATVGFLMRLWDITARHPTIPSDMEIREAMAHVGYRHLSFLPRERAVVIDIPGLVLDTGGAGKGYAVGCVAECLRGYGVTSASVDFGGNLNVLGPYRAGEWDSRPWRVGVQRPWGKLGDAIGFLDLQDEAVATSGAYDRYFTDANQIYHHILDPRTGRPVRNEVLGVTIVSDSPLLTDVLSTAFFVLGEEQGAQAARRLRDRAAIEYLLVKQDEIVISAGLAKRFHPAAELKIKVRSD